MLFLTRPANHTIEKFLRDQSGCRFSYAEVGATATSPPQHYQIDHNRIRLGEGEEVFLRATEAIRRWKMFDFHWLQLIDPRTPIEPGATVVVLARHLGFWSLNACRIVYVIDADQQVRRFGFAYGTLPDHAERGEERFSVELDHRNNSVWYDILAFSRPNQFLTRFGYPVARWFQKRFARDSKMAMLRAVSG
jgi:uncharacterized protein (UPF0548 family)